MNATTLPQWVLDILSAVPQAGEGFHNWLFVASRALWKCGRDESEIRALLENAASTCGRYVPQREIDDAIRNSQLSASQPLAAQHRSWPVLNEALREKVIKCGPSLSDLWESSQIRFEDNLPHAEQIIDLLFSGNPLLCVGRTQSDFQTLPRNRWHGHLAQMQFIVPSPLVKWIGRTKDGRESQHALDAVGPRKFLVIEQDAGSLDQQCAVLWQLAQFAPLALVVFSGGKSIHGWFYCHGQDEEKVLRPFMRYAVSLGACLSTWTRSQFVRLPDGRRSNGKRQAVYYFRPEVIK